VPDEPAKLDENPTKECPMPDSDNRGFNRNVFGRERLKGRITEAMALWSVTGFAIVCLCFAHCGLVVVDEDGAPREFILAGFYAMGVFTALIGLSFFVWGSEPFFVLKEDALIFVPSGPQWLARRKIAWSDIMEFRTSAGELVLKTRQKTVRMPLLTDSSESSALLTAIRARVSDADR
jgi:lipid-A-disaccharide synthase-like uncharacterized protein